MQPFDLWEKQSVATRWYSQKNLMPMQASSHLKKKLIFVAYIYNIIPHAAHKATHAHSI